MGKLSVLAVQVKASNNHIHVSQDWGIFAERMMQKVHRFAWISAIASGSPQSACSRLARTSMPESLPKFVGQICAGLRKVRS